MATPEYQLKLITVWFAFIEDGEWTVEHDEFLADNIEDALVMAREDYPGCQQYSVRKILL
jgi:hypothetical protein